jgi:hypothetical protein
MMRTSVTWRRWSRRAVSSAMTGLALLGASMLIGAGAARADGSGDFPGGATPTGPAVQVVDRCALYANYGGFGADCATGGGGTDIKKLLGGEKFPECKYELLTDANKDQVPFVPTTHGGEDGHWYVQTCLKGIKPDGSGDFTRLAQAVWFSTEHPPPALTDNQHKATFFWLRPESGAQLDRTVFDGVRDVAMRARVSQLEVRPGVGDTQLNCPGAGEPYNRAEDVYHQHSICRYLYERSSARAPGQKVLVSVTADWVVEFQRADGTWQRLGLFPLTKEFPTPVQEIQTVAR